MIKRNKKSTSLLILAIFFLGLPFLTRADIASYTLEQGIPFIGGKGQTLSYDNFSALFQKFITAVYIIAAIAAFIKIFLAGLKWFTSGGSSKAISQSREDIKNALIGLAFLFLAGTLLVFINPNLNKISSIFIGDIKATPANESGSLKSIGGYYAQAILSTKLDVLAKTAFTNIANPPGFRFTITTGCRVNNDSSCNPNYCKPSPYTCSICSMGSDSCGEPLTITPCHFNGNCVDLVPSGSYTDAIFKLNAAGLDVLDESGDVCGNKDNRANDHLHVALPGNIETTGGCFHQHK